MFSGLTYRSILVYLPAYFRDKVGEASFLSLEGIVLAGFLSTIILLAGTVGQWGGGLLAERGHRERNYALTYLAAVPLVFLMGHSGGSGLFLAGLVFAVVFFSLQPQKNTLMAHYAHRKAQGLAYGFVFFLEFGIGSFGASLAGMVADRWGMNYIFDLSAALLLFIAAIALLLIPKHRTP
jgi:predicted MFS family arabinose efflux permease